ncbi:hypothetical protein BsWGS_06507 [Bradybaena similaris]
MPSKNRNKKRNKRRRLAASADIHHEVAASESSYHSPLMYSSRESTASSCKSVANSVATPSSHIYSSTLSSPTLPSGMYSRTETGCSVDVGKNKKSLMADIINNKSSEECSTKCTTMSDGHLLDAINSESSCEAVALLIMRMSSFTFSQEGLNQALISACRRGHKLLVQTLVRVGANIEHRDENGNTPLLICAEHGFTGIVQFLVSKNADVKAWNSTGNTALILSVHPSGSTDLTRFLLEQQNVDIHHENQDGHTALTRATRFMDVDTMRLLLEKSMVRKTDRGCRTVYGIEYGDNPFFSNSAQIIKQEVISAKVGLKNVYTILKQHLITRISPIELAIKVSDTKSLDIFLDCQFSSSSDKKRYIDSALMYIFSKSRYSSEQTFSLGQISIIQKLLQHGADVNQDYGNLVSLVVEAGNFQLVELMCTHGAALQRHRYSGDKDPLCIAARKGRQDLIELLLKNQADMNGYDFSESALDYALRNDHTECAKLLIQHGAKMDVTSALRSAVEHQKPVYMRFLFENYKHEIIDCFSKTTVARKLLILAAEKENSEIIGLILDAGIDVNDADSYGQTPLMASKNRAVAEFLIQRGADVNHIIEGRNGNETPLSHMINRNCKSASTVELCKVLIDNGASVNCRDGDGKTPLMMAASNGCVNMLQMLLNNGTDVSDKDNKGNTALLHAVTDQCFENVSCLIDFTRDKKNVINIQNNEGLTPLIVSVKKGNVVIMKKLIENGADVNIKDNNENAALHHLLIVCPYDKEEILTFLLKAGSQVNCQNKDGLSPLMLAAKKSNSSLMSKLLDAGAEVNAVSKNNNSQTAMSFLPGISYLEKENILCIESLLHRDADSSYLSQEYLPRLIIQNHINVIPKLIQHGLGPADVKAKKLPLVCTRFGVPVTLSPLSVALLHGNISLAQYFVDILFLTSSDLFMFANNKDMEHLLKEEDQEKSINFLQELSSQPMSLVKLSLVTVSAAVGSSPGREARVDSLPLPQMMKDRLRFKSMNGEDLILLKLHPELDDITITTNNGLLVSLLRDQFEIFRYVDSDDDDDYFVYASDSDDDSFYFDSD